MNRLSRLFLMVVFISTSAFATGPVVVELFESQGCSSCPPSERTMAKLQQEFDDSVILLTFHVDYWDYLGWKDVFSDARYTERQKIYGQAFAQDSIYTPEMVVNGAVGFNGADTDRAVSEIRKRQPERADDLTVALTPTSPTSSVLTIRRESSALARTPHSLLAVIVEDAAPVHVLRGENSGETMSGLFAVRNLQVIPVGQKKITLSLPEGANPARTRVAVLARGDSGEILAAQSLSWAKH